MTEHTQVLIIGSGPTGLTQAVDLQRRGIDCLVIERDDQPHHHSRGKGLQPRTLEVLDDLGVIDQVLAHGEFRQRIHLYKDRKELAALSVGLAAPRADVPYPNIVMLPQWRTCAILATRLQALGGDIRHGLTLEHISQDEERVTATVTDATGQRRLITADFLVGCDGGRSTVRHQLGIAFEGEARPSARYLLGDVRVAGLEPQNDHEVSSHAWFGSEGDFLGLAGLPGTGGWQIGASVDLGDESVPSVATFQRLLEERTGRTDLRVTEATWLSKFAVSVRLAANYRQGRVLLAGDAAHVHPPTGGQGMNTGIQDAYNLGWKLALHLEGVAAEGLLDTYQTERRPIARDVLSKSTDIMDVVMSDNPVVAGLVQRVMLPLLSVPMLNRALLGRVSQVDVGYRDSPLALGTIRGRVRAGDRAPDARAIDLTSGQQVRLQEILRGPAFTLLSWGRAALPTVPSGVRYWTILGSADDRERDIPTLLDHNGTIRRAYRPKAGDAVLVRPDGYVAWRGPLGELSRCWTGGPIWR